MVGLKEICLLLTFIWTSCLKRVVCGKVLTSITFREKLSGTKYTVSAGNNGVSQESELRCCQRLIDKESGREIKKGRESGRKLVEPGGPLQCKIESAESDT